jgi:hypothetical protein
VLSSFINDVKNSSLPQVSWIVAPAGYCEHPSYTPDYGAHYVNYVLRTLMANEELWQNTALFVTYDEHDGFFDHQLPPFPEASVADEHIDGLPIGPGTRVPMIICSPSGTVAPAALSTGQIPVVTATAGAGTLALTLANEGGQAVLYSLTPNDYEARSQTVTVPGGSTRTVSWPANADGYYDVVITANSGDGFRRRYAGRIS